MEREKLMYIIRGQMTKNSGYDFYPATSDRNLWDLISFLRDDWYRIEYRAVTNRDSGIEENIRKCESYGDKVFKENLREYFYRQMNEIRKGA